MQPAADGEVGLAGRKRIDQRRQCLEVGGEVDVHVGADRGRRCEPRRAQREAAPSNRDVQRHEPARVLALELVSHGERAVRRAVVRHDHPPLVLGVRVAPREQRARAHGELPLLVVDREDQIDGGHHDRW